MSAISDFALDKIKSGLFSWYPRVYTQTHKKHHTEVAAVKGCVGFCHFPGFPTPVLNVNSLFSFVLGGGGGMMRGTKTPNNKKGPQQCHYLRDIYHRCLLLFILLFLSLSLCALLFTFTLLHRISLSSALESSSISAYTEVHYEKT